MSSLAARIANAQAERDLSEAPVDIFHAFSSGTGSQEDWRREQDEEEEEDVGEPGGGRISMYVRIVNEMFETVLKGEEYLFTEHERAVLRKFLALKYEPKYLLTRLLLRKTNKIFSHNELSVRYSSELGEDNVAAYMDILKSQFEFSDDETRIPPEPSSGSSQPTGDLPQHDRFFSADELASLQHLQTVPEASSNDQPDVKSSKYMKGTVNTVTSANSSSASKAKSSKSVNDASNPIVLVSSDDESKEGFVGAEKRVSKLPKIDMKSISTGLSKKEEEKDPELAKAIRLSKYEALNRTVSATDTTKKLKVCDIGESKPSLMPQTKTDGPAKASRSTPAKAVPSGPEVDDFYRLKEGDTENITAFARGSTEMTVEEMVRQLNMAELTLIAKELKCWKSKYTRPEIITALLSSASKQTRLSFTSVPDASSPARFRNMSRTNSMPTPARSRQSTLAFTPKHANSFSGQGGQGEPLETPTRPLQNSSSTRSPVSPQTGKTILYDKIVSALGGRAIQVSIAFRRLIWRVNLVFYRSTITPSSGVAKSLMLPEILTSAQKRNYPEINPRRSTIWPSRDALLEYERALELEAIVDESLGEQNHSTGAWVGPSGYGFGTKGGRLEGARRVRKVWEGVWDRWKLAAKRASSSTKGAGSRHVLDRFTLGHILTRVVSKGATALGILHEYDLECQVLRSLLDQRVWRRGKRGAWYDRLALVLMTHYGGDVEKKREAVLVCHEGLTDPDTHLIYRPRLSRRLKRLEKQLDLPADERHVCEAELSVSEKRHLKAERLESQARSHRRSTVEHVDDDEAVPTADRMGAKTLWQGREGEVGVEEWVLEWWEDQGYKGFHSESSILTTLFGLLFWPILYMDIPGAFETPYQLAPLDLGDDSFYRSRQADIEERLKNINNTSLAIKMLREIDEVERDRGTLAIGVNWTYERQALEEIITCMGGQSLSILCRMFCEEYGHRASGVPDLIVWNIDEKKCRFVEVKSPNDHLSETQKVWISVMQSAGVDVEVCHVAEASKDEATKRKRQRLNNGGWGRSKHYDYGDESDLQERDEDEDEDGEDIDQWQFEEGNEAKSRWKGEGRLLTKAQLAEEAASDLDEPQDNKENFRVVTERSRSVATSKRKSRPVGREVRHASPLCKRPSLEIRGDVSAPIEL